MKYTPQNVLVHVQVVEQLREALELTGEELRKHPAFKPNFCG